MSKLENIDQNRSHYDNQYNSVNIEWILNILKRYESYLDGATKTDISWVGMYVDDFKSKIVGKKVFELGCGDCVNVAIMAALGAEVIANDISTKSGEIIEALNKNYKFNTPIVFKSGDFTECDFEEDSIDFVIGKAFLHHLTLEHENEILEKVTKVLKLEGEARFFEPAINSKLLDWLRWATPMNDRPSKLFQPKAFREWEENDPHPHRDNSSKHFSEIGQRYFNEVDIIPMGVLERFNRLLPVSNKKKGVYKRFAFKLEKVLPQFINKIGARSQVVIYKKKKVNV